MTGAVTRWVIKVGLVTFLFVVSIQDVQACVCSDLSGTADSFLITSDGSDFANAAIQGGIALWSGCAGYGTAFPDLRTSGSGDIPISVEFHNTSSASETGGCAEIDRAKDPQTGKLLWATIRLFATTAGGADCTEWQGISMAHELGHAYGLKNSSCAGYIMAAPGSSTGVRSSECAQAADNYQTTLEQPEDPDEDTPLNQDCSGGGCSPILIDVYGNGIRLSSADVPVAFDIDGDGLQEWLSWTLPGTDDGFLALDRDGNRQIEDGRELFGNFTPQMPSDEPNGFEALRLFDLAEFGGNDDGLIDSRDAVYEDLIVWRDLDRDGVSQTWEMTPLAEVGVVSIDLDYIRTERRDRYGNLYRWSSHISFGHGRRLGATDVIFLTVDVGEE